MKIEILAKSSGEEPYEVIFSVVDKKLHVTCNCKAGIFGQLCKHKTELMSGDETRLFNDGDVPKLKEVAEVLARTPEVAEVAGQIAESEKIIRQEQAKLKNIKKNFGARLKQGVSIV